MDGEVGPTEGEVQERCAVRIQALARGAIVRQELYDLEEEVLVTHMQAIARGFLTRRRLEKEPASLSDALLEDEGSGSLDQ